MENTCGNCKHIGINNKRRYTRHKCCNEKSVFVNCTVRLKDKACKDWEANLNDIALVTMQATEAMIKFGEAAQNFLDSEDGKKVTNAVKNINRHCIS